MVVHDLKHPTESIIDNLEVIQDFVTGMIKLSKSLIEKQDKIFMLLSKLNETIKNVEVELDKNVNPADYLNVVVKNQISDVSWNLI